MELTDVTQDSFQHIKTLAAAEGPESEKLVSMLLSAGRGCMTGIVQAFEAIGLGHLTSSWMEGKSDPVEPLQVQTAMGSQIGMLASMLGISPEAVSQKLAQWLPMIIHALNTNANIQRQPLR